MKNLLAQRPDATDNGPTPDAPGIEYARGKGRNTPWIIAGALLVTLGGLGAFLVAVSLADRVDVVVSARDLAAGDLIQASDLTTVQISGGDGARAIAASRIPELTGSIIDADIPAGAILHPDQLLDADGAEERTVIVGASLAPGEYPLSELIPGNRVQVIEVGAANDFSDGEAAATVLVEAEVVAVTSLSRTDELLVSVRIDERFAPRFSERAQQRRIRLVVLEQPDARPAPVESSGSDEDDDAADETTTTTTTTEPPASEPAPNP